MWWACTSGGAFLGGDLDGSHGGSTEYFPREEEEEL